MPWARCGRRPAPCNRAHLLLGPGRARRSPRVRTLRPLRPHPHRMGRMTFPAVASVTACVYDLSPLSWSGAPGCSLRWHWTHHGKEHWWPDEITRPSSALAHAAFASRPDASGRASWSARRMRCGTPYAPVSSEPGCRLRWGRRGRLSPCTRRDRDRSARLLHRRPGWRYRARTCELGATPAGTLCQRPRRSEFLCRRSPSLRLGMSPVSIVSLMPNAPAPLMSNAPAPEWSGRA
jgi:hypothetical protein